MQAVDCVVVEVWDRKRRPTLRYAIAIAAAVDVCRCNRRPRSYLKCVIAIRLDMQSTSPSSASPATRPTVATRGPLGRSAQHVACRTNREVGIARVTYPLSTTEAITGPSCDTALLLHGPLRQRATDNRTVTEARIQGFAGDTVMPPGHFGAFAQGLASCALRQHTTGTAFPVSPVETQPHASRMQLHCAAW